MSMHGSRMGFNTMHYALAYLGSSYVTLCGKLSGMRISGFRAAHDGGAHSVGARGTRPSPACVCDSLCVCVMHVLKTH